MKKCFRFYYPGHKKIARNKIYFTYYLQNWNFMIANLSYDLLFNVMEHIFFLSTNRQNIYNLQNWNFMIANLSYDLLFNVMEHIFFLSTNRQNIYNHVKRNYGIILFCMGNMYRVTKLSLGCYGMLIALRDVKCYIMNQFMLITQKTSQI